MKVVKETTVAIKLDQEEIRFFKVILEHAKRSTEITEVKNLADSILRELPCV